MGGTLNTKDVEKSAMRIAGPILLAMAIGVVLLSVVAVNLISDGNIKISHYVPGFLFGLCFVAIGAGCMSPLGKFFRLGLLLGIILAALAIYMLCIVYPL